MSTNKFTTNNNPTLVAVSNADGETPVYVWADPSTHALLTSGGGGSSGTQYAEGTTTTPATGTAALGRYESAPSGVSTDGGLYAPLMDNFHQLKVVPVGTVTVANGGTFAVQATLQAGSALVGKVSIDQTTLGSTNNVSVSGTTGAGTSVLIKDDTAFGENVTTGIMSTALRLWDGAAYDRLPGNSTDGALVNLGANNDVTVTGTVTATGSATGSAVPAGAFYVATNNSGNLTGITSAANQGDGVALSGGLTVGNWIYNGTTFDRWRSVINATNSTGTGIAATGSLAQFDDTSPTSITENQFGNLRISANRNLYSTLRDAAGNERGANVTAGNALVVDGSAVTQPVSYATTGSGTATGALRVELANNSTGIIATVGAVTAITNALPAGTNAIGKLAANSGVDIGDVDVTSAVITGGGVAHDAAAGSVNPLLTGGYASAAAPTDVSADVDSVRTWHLRNGAQASVLTAAGALIGGDAANGLDVDITRMSALVAGSALVGKVGIDQTTPGTTNAVAATNLPTTVDTNSGNKSASTIRTVLATDQPALTTAGLISVKTDQTTHGTTDLVASDLTKVAGTAIVNGGTAGSQSVGGMVANNGTINSAVNPILVGGQAVSSENAANTTAKLSQLVTDLVGKLIVLPYANPENFVSGAITSAMTGTTSTSLIAAPAAGLRNYITQITVSNSHATVGTDIIIQDGSGGTTLYTAPAAAVYGGAALTFPTPLRQPTTATAIYVANVTTGASTKVSASGYKGI